MEDGALTGYIMAAIERMSILARIVQMGTEFESTHQQQSIANVRIYSGADADFTLNSDDGETYVYESGDGIITHLHWKERCKQLYPRWRAGMGNSREDRGAIRWALIRALR
ncbi:MAG TPA: DUF5110 domain-containing protein [Terracidiphilus sp.]